MTTFTARPPISYTQTAYDSHISYDSALFYSGVLVNSTQYSGRKPIWLSYLTDDSWNIITDENLNPIWTEQVNTQYTVRPSI